jgi:hypothetical protein
MGEIMTYKDRSTRWALLGSPTIPTANVPMFRESDSSSAVVIPSSIGIAGRQLALLNPLPGLSAIRLFPTSGDIGETG